MFVRVPPAAFRQRQSTPGENTQPVADCRGHRLGADRAGQLAVEEQGRVTSALGFAPGPRNAGIGPAGDNHGATHQAIGTVAYVEGRDLVGAVEQPALVGDGWQGNRYALLPV